MNVSLCYYACPGKSTDCVWREFDANKQIHRGSNFVEPGDSTRPCEIVTGRRRHATKLGRVLEGSEALYEK